MTRWRDERVQEIYKEIGACYVPIIADTRGAINYLGELEDAIESGELQFVENQPLTLEQVKALNRDDFVYIIDKSYPNLTTYYQVCETPDKDLFFECIGIGVGRSFYEYFNYGKDWFAYKNKEQAQVKLKELERKE